MNYGLEDPFKTSWKEDLIIGVPLTILLLLLIYIPIWLLAGIRTSDWCVNSQKIVEMSPVGDSYGTTYFVRGDTGGIDESEEPKRIGDPYCFHKESSVYYKFRNFLKPWKD